MQKPLDLASAFGTLGIGSGHALDLLKPMLTLLALELVKRHGPPQEDWKFAYSRF